MSQIYGNHLIFLGTDGDTKWGNSSRFLRMLYADQVLKLKFTVSQKEDVDEEYGKLGIDFEGGKSGWRDSYLQRRIFTELKKNHKLLK